MSILNWKYEKLHIRKESTYLKKLKEESKANYIKSNRRRINRYIIKIAKLNAKLDEVKHGQM